jgi:hypothetical protein
VAELTALRMTSEAARRLGAACGHGRVHSVFARTINILIGQSPEAPWVSVHGGTSIPSPFGLACAGWPDRAPPVGSPVSFGGAIGFATSSLRTDNAVIIENHLPGPLPDPDPKSLTLALEYQRQGLLPVAAAVLGRGHAPGDTLGRAALPMLTRLFHASANLDAASVLETLAPLLGLGPGLTPSGDDCVMGWLAGVWTARAQGRQFVRSLDAALMAAAATTNDVSRAFLGAALHGAVSEPMYCFVTTRTMQCLVDVVTTGETSGGDLLAGYLLARAALASPA